MKAALAAWLLRRWYGGVAPGPGLRLLAALYAGLLRLREVLYRCGWKRIERLPVPVIVVGNLVAGGSGKTPLTIWLATTLARAGWKPGIVSRGYGRSSREPVRVRADIAAELCGDEPLLMARETGVPVQVDADRVAAARALIAAGCTLIIADDGLQHRRLGRDIEIEVIDGDRRYGNGRLLPAGPLREPAGRRVDLRVVNGASAGADAWTMQLRIAAAVPLAGGAPRPLQDFRNGQVHAVAGIGNPERFFAALRQHGIAVVAHAFPDHHRYSFEDFAFAPSLPLLMTAKDAVKCASLGLTDAWSVPVAIEVAAGFDARLGALLANWRPDDVRP